MNRVNRGRLRAAAPPWGKQPGEDASGRYRTCHECPPLEPAGAVLSAAYAGRALAVIWQKAPPGVEAGFDTEQPGTRRVAPGMVLPLALLAGGAATLGVLVLPPVSVAWRAAVGETVTRRVSLSWVGRSGSVIAAPRSRCRHSGGRSG